MAGRITMLALSAWFLAKLGTGVSGIFAAAAAALTGAL